MRRYIIMVAALFALVGFSVYLNGTLLFEEAGYVMIIIYLGFICSNYQDMLGMQSFSLQRIGSRINAALLVQKTLFFRILIFVSAAHLICMTGYITSERMFNGLQALQFYFLTLINLNITCLIIYLFSMMYGKIKAVGLYMIVVLLSGLSNTISYDILYMNSAFGSSAIGTQRVINIIISYIIVFALVIWLWNKYKKADLQV